MPQPTLKQIFMENFNVPITKRQVEQFAAHIQKYELRDDHALAFNTDTIRIHDAYFIDSRDANILFDTFQINRTLFKRYIGLCPSINKDFKVAGNDFNICTIWVAHLVLISNLPKSVKELALFNLFKYLNYKFFCGATHSLLPHKPDPEIMKATIDQLSLKFGIKQAETSTWKLVIEQYSRSIYDPKTSIHLHTLELFQPDEACTYVITDISSRIKNRIKSIVSEFYKTRAKGERLGSTSMMVDNGEDKEVADIVSHVEQCIDGVSNSVLNINKFVRSTYIQVACKLNSGIRPDNLRSILIKFSDEAVKQYHNKAQYDTIVKNNETIYVGYYALISNLIHKTYRACQSDKSVNMRSRVSILDKTRNMYRSSRVNDPDILNIKNSVARLIEMYSNSTRPTTVISLKLAFITYIILLSFDYS